MRYVEIVLLIMMMSISLATVTHLNLIPQGTTNDLRGVNIFDQMDQNITSGNNAYNSGLQCLGESKTVVVDPNLNCSLDENADALNCRMEDYMTKRRDRDWFVKSQTILEPGIVTSVIDFIDIFATGVTSGHELISCYVPEKSGLRGVLRLFTIPLLFLYLVALFQVISGRNLEGTK